jgi:hypothetical protein
MKYSTAILLALLAPPAWAEEPMPPETVYVMPQIPSEQVKIDALKLAYKINGNSMVGHNEMIDLTKPIPVASIRIPAAEVVKDVPRDTEHPVFTKPVDKPAGVQKAEVDVCSRHGMHKVVTGSSWRCRK